MKHAYLLLLHLALTACVPPAPTPRPPDTDADAAPGPPPERSDAGTDAGDLSPCARAWQRVEQLGCTVTVPRTGTWVQACDNAEDNAVDMHTTCVVSASSCTEVRACLGER